MDYKKFYEEQCNIEIPIGYEIHHIDCNRSNNDIRNLVMLPFMLHQNYHRLKNEMESRFNVNYTITSILDGGNGINMASSNLYKKFIEVIEECNKYADYRDYLLGLIPDLHSLNGREHGTKKNV